VRKLTTKSCADLKEFPKLGDLLRDHDQQKNSFEGNEPKQCIYKRGIEKDGRRKENKKNMSTVLFFLFCV
jgi:hypothetical protein